MQRASRMRAAGAGVDADEIDRMLVPIIENIGQHLAGDEGPSGGIDTAANTGLHASAPAALLPPADEGSSVSPYAV